MLWILLAISTHLCWGMVNIGDKFVVSKKIANPYVYMIWLSLLGVLTVFFIPFIDFQLPTFKTFLILMLISALFFYGGLPYIKAMQLEEPTRINVWWGLIPVFSLIIGRLFLNEYLDFRQIIAFCLLASGTIIASIHIKKSGGFRLSKAVWLMIVASLLFALYGVLFHFITNEITFAQGFVWTNIIQSFFALLMLFSSTIRRDFWENIKKADRGFVGIVLGLFSLEKFGILLNQWALSLSSAALVYAMEGFQVLFVFVIASLLSVFLPNIVKEELDKRNLILKILALVLMITGILVLAFA